MSPCPICNETDSQLLIKFDSWKILKCSGCGVGILDPLPGKEELKRLYDNDYFNSQYGEGLETTSDAFRRRISQERHRVKFCRSAKKDGSLLDLGCGLGYFMYACRLEGYTVQGADVSESTADYVRNQLGIPIKIGELENLEFPEGTFDIITMWHFLEHTRDPGNCIAKAVNWLKPDGALIIDVPNYESTDANYYWQDWVGWQIPCHLYHFSPEALKYLLSKYDLKIVRKKDYHSEYIKKKLVKIPLINIFARPIAKLYSGTSVAVAALKY